MNLEIKKIKNKIELDTTVQKGCNWCLHVTFEYNKYPLSCCEHDWYDRSTNPNPFNLKQSLEAINTFVMRLCQQRVETLSANSDVSVFCKWFIIQKVLYCCVD